MKEINPLHLAFVRQDLECCVQFCASLYKKDMAITGVRAEECSQDGQRLEQ